MVSAMHPAKAQRQHNYSIARQTRSPAHMDLPACHGTGTNDPFITLVDMLVVVNSRIRGTKTLSQESLLMVWCLAYSRTL